MANDDMGLEYELDAPASIAGLAIRRCHGRRLLVRPKVCVARRATRLRRNDGDPNGPDGATVRRGGSDRTGIRSPRDDFASGAAGECAVLSPIEFGRHLAKW